MLWLKGCPRCGGDLYRNRDIYGTYVCCLQCTRYYDEEITKTKSHKGSWIKEEGKDSKNVNTVEGQFV